MTWTLGFGAAVVLIWAAWCFGPLFRPARPVLPVLVIGKTGKPFPSSKDKKSWTSCKRLEKLFARLNAKGFHAVLPKEILSGKTLPQNPVLLVFAGGYQTLYADVLPLLEKYGLKAASALPAALIGQYDAWQSPQDGPWQNLLNEEQVKQINKNPRVEFISYTLDGQTPEGLDDDSAVWHLTESKTRLKSLYGINARAVYFPAPDPRRPAVLYAAQKEYSLVIGNQPGNNPLPLAQKSLCVFRLHSRTCLPRLLWQIRRG